MVIRAWCWRMGHHDPGRLGIRHRQFRMVDRYRARGHADLRHPAAAEARLANVHQPVFGSHDAIRRGLRRHVSDSAPRTAVAGLLVVALSQYDVAVAATAEPADLGRIRGFDLSYGFLPVLVHRA